MYKGEWPLLSAKFTSQPVFKSSLNTLKLLLLQAIYNKVLSYWNNKQEKEDKHEESKETWTHSVLPVHIHSFLNHSQSFRCIPFPNMFIQLSIERKRKKDSISKLEREKWYSNTLFIRLVCYHVTRKNEKRSRAKGRITPSSLSPFSWPRRASSRNALSTHTHRMREQKKRDSYFVNVDVVFRWHLEERKAQLFSQLSNKKQDLMRFQS